MTFSLLAIGLAACESAGPDAEQCRGKCDGLGDEAAFGQLMPRAPSTPGIISIARNQDAWLCEVVGAQGDIVLLSQEYTSRASALNGALAIEENGVDEGRYEVQQSGEGWSFVLRAGNGQVLADSKTYATEAEARAAVAEARDLVAGIVQFRAALSQGAGFQLGRDGADWSFELRGERGEPILASQTYSRRRDAITGIESVRENGRNADRYELLDSPPRFVLEAANGEEIAASSASFASLEEAEAAMTATRELLASERVANPW